MKNNYKNLSIVINDCIEIENFIKEIHLIQKNSSKYNSKYANFKFFTDEEDGDIKIINEIKILEQY